MKHNINSETSLTDLALNLESEINVRRLSLEQIASQDVTKALPDWQFYHNKWLNPWDLGLAQKVM